MKYPLLLLLLCSLYACNKESTVCLELTEEDVELQVEVKHNIIDQGIDYLDTIDLSITFPKNLVNKKTSSTFDITDQEPRFALFIRKQEDNLIDPVLAPPAKDKLEYSILKGEEISVSRYYLAPAAEEAINIRPEFSQDQYSIDVQLFHPSEPGTYAFYWHFLHRDFLLFDSEDFNQLPSCKDFIKVNITNSGTANLHLGENDPTFTRDSLLLKEFGLFFVEMRI